MLIQSISSFKKIARCYNERLLSSLFRQRQWQPLTESPKILANIRGEV